MHHKYLEARRVQIIEASDLGVRAAVLRMRQTSSRVEFLLIPMIHVAAPSFYSAVQAKLGECDSILVEGVDSPQAGILTLSYRTIPYAGRMGLVYQGDALDLRPFRDRLMHADLDRAEFEKGWRRVPFFLRLQMLVLAPFVGLYMLFFGTRDLIAQYAEFNDLPSRDEVLMYDREVDAIEDALTGQRDARLVETIKRMCNEPAGKPATVGVLFGAQHMRAVIRYLTENQNYQVAKAEWITVFEY
jgi:hypothetical protein